jgi:rod shape determining protein RodA
VTIQPAEFAKTATALLLAKYLNDPLVNLNKFAFQWKAALIIGIPMLLIIGSNETGSALVFASFLILLYREGLPGTYPALFIGGIVLFVSALLVKAWIILLVLVLFAGLFVLFMPIYLQRDPKTYLRLSGAIAVIMTLAL